MAYTQTQLDTLKAAYASGILSVEYDGRSVTYSSRSDLLATINDIEAALSPSTATPSRTVGVYRSGF